MWTNFHHTKEFQFYASRNVLRKCVAKDSLVFCYASPLFLLFFYTFALKHTLKLERLSISDYANMLFDRRKTAATFAHGRFALSLAIFLVP